PRQKHHSRSYMMTLDSNLTFKVGALFPREVKQPNGFVSRGRAPTSVMALRQTREAVEASRQYIEKSRQLMREVK
ncbi:MAG: hypothetical protein AAGL89_15285, partial [Pseudomonadota bacterium]